MLTSIVVLSLNNLEQTTRCVHQIRTHTDGSYELIVVDNGSTDGSAEWLAAQPDIRLVRNRENAGFAAACNQGVCLANGDHYLLLNNDTIVSHRWMSQLIAALYEDDRIAAVGPLSNFVIPAQLYDPKLELLTDDSLHRFMGAFNRHDPSRWKFASALSGFCLLIRKEAWSEIGPLDEDYALGGYEDIDYGYRALLAGWKLRIAGDTFVYHEGNRSFESNRLDVYEVARANRRRFIRKWGFNPERLILIRDTDFWPADRSFPRPRPDPNRQTVPNGWYAMRSDGGVFRVERGRKRPLVSMDVYRRLGLSDDRIARHCDSLLDRLPDGEPIRLELHAPSSFPDVYVARDPNGGMHLISGGIRYPIYDYASFQALRFLEPETVNATFDELHSITVGWPLRENVWEEHELIDHLVYAAPDGRYYYGETQRLRLIPGADVMQKYGWQASRAVPMPYEKFARIPKSFDIESSR